MTHLSNVQEIMKGCDENFKYENVEGTECVAGCGEDGIYCNECLGIQEGYISAVKVELEKASKIQNECNSECSCEYMDENNSGLGFTKACNYCYIASILNIKDCEDAIKFSEGRL